MHIPVLLSESVDALNLKVGDIVLDGTLGGGGHTAEIVKRYGSGVKVIGLDLDKDAIGRAEETLKGMKADTVFRTIGFQDFESVLDELHIPHVDAVLLDLGISSFQLEVAERGFSFMRDEPLLMTMKKDPNENDLTAMEVLNTWEEESLADIIYGFGEERYSRKIAKAIVEYRKVKQFETTKDLADLITKVIGKHGKIHPATKTFQAIRIAVNGELTNIENSIPKMFAKLNTGGRFAIITFHSLEDRIVKRAFKELVGEGKAKAVTKKPIVPSVEELKVNPRARSSKLRIIEKI